MKLWLLFTRSPAQLQVSRALSRLTGPAWDACDGLEPEDVATDDPDHLRCPATVGWRGGRERNKLEAEMGRE